MLKLLYSDSSLLDLFLPASVTTTKGHNFKYFKPCCNSHHRQNIFNYRTIDNWNRLPAHIIYANSIDTFKNELDNFFW